MRNAGPQAAVIILLVVATGSLFAADEGAEAVQRFRDNKPHSYQGVVEQGEAAVPGLVAVLRDRKLEETIRFSAANALGDIGSDNAVAPLVEALKDPAFNVRRCAALALGKIGDRAAAAPLRQLAANDPFAW